MRATRRHGDTWQPVRAVRARRTASPRVHDSSGRAPSREASGSRLRLRKRQHEQFHARSMIEPTNFTGPMVPSGHGPPQGVQQQMMTPVPFHMAGAYQQPTKQQAHGFLAPTAAAAAAAAATAAASAMHSPQVPAAPPSTPAQGDRNGSRSRHRVDMNEMNQRVAYLEETNRRLQQDLQLQRQQQVLGTNC